MQSNLDKRYQTMVVLWFSLLASVGMYLLVALFVAPQHANEPQNSSSHLMIVVLTASGTFLVIVSVVVKQRILERSVDKQDVNLVQKALVVACAMCEVSALLGLLERFTIGNREYYRLLRYLRPYLRLLLPALLLTFALNLLGILQPKFTEYAIDWYILPRKLSGLELLVGLYVAVQILRLVFSYFQALLLNTVGQYVMFDMRRELYDKLQHQEVAYYDRNPVGRIMTRLTSDVDSLNELFTAGITDLLGDLVMIVAIIGVMVWMDVRLTLVTLLTVPMLWAATTWFRKGARKGYDLVRTRIARINAFLQEHFAGAQTVQIFNAEVKSLYKFDEINTDYRKANLDTIFFYAVFFPLVDFIGAVGIALIIWYGGYRVMQNTPGHTVMTLGALVAFIQYSGFLFQPIRDISDKYNVLQSAVVASHRIFKTLDLPIAILNPTAPRKAERAQGRIEFQNVWFAYKDEDWVLKDVSFLVEPGQSIALVGHT